MERIKIKTIPLISLLILISVNLSTSSCSLITPRWMLAFPISRSKVFTLILSKLRPSREAFPMIHRDNSRIMVPATKAITTLPMCHRLWRMSVTKIATTRGLRILAMYHATRLLRWVALCNLIIHSAPLFLSEIRLPAPPMKELSIRSRIWPWTMKKEGKVKLNQTNRKRRVESKSKRCNQIKIKSHALKTLRCSSFKTLHRMLLTILTTQCKTPKNPKAMKTIPIVKWEESEAHVIRRKSSPINNLLYSITTSMPRIMKILIKS